MNNPADRLVAVAAGKEVPSEVHQQVLDERPVLEIDRLQKALQRVRDGVQFCIVCGTVSDKELCRICADPRRDRTKICVVEEPKDVQAVERTRE